MRRPPGWRPRHASVVEPDINVTPLVDVVLVLLIIFMVVAPRMEQDIPVTLPGVFNPDPEVEAQAPPIQVTMKEAGVYHFNGRPYDLEALITELAAVHANDPLRRLDVRADAKLRYGDVRTLYARLHQIGFPGVSLLASDLSHQQARGAPTPPLSEAAPADALNPAPAPQADGGAAAP
jgi:biopolymer transport protein TolR